MSSLTGFFDILYLGVFIIFSAAFNSRFYSTTKPPPTLVEELAYTEHQFHSLLHIFSQRFIVVLKGEPVAHSYVVDWMLGEFAAAVVVFAKALWMINSPWWWNELKVLFMVLTPWFFPTTCSAWIVITCISYGLDLIYKYSHV